MATSATIGHTSSEVRTTISIDTADGRRTIRRRPGRSNSRRAAINASWYGSDR